MSYVIVAMGFSVVSGLGYSFVVVAVYDYFGCCLNTFRCASADVNLTFLHLLFQ